MTLFIRFINDRSGTTQIEYAVIAALVSVVIVGSAGAVGNKVTDMYTYLSVHAVPVLK